MPGRDPGQLLLGHLEKIAQMGHIAATAWSRLAADR